MSEPGERKTIEIYLNDHFAGATTAIELIDDMLEHGQDPQLSSFLRQLRAELEEDFELLERIARLLGVEHQRLKQLAADLGESLARAKLVRGGVPPELSLLLDLETLSVGIWGRTRLWRSLAVADRMGEQLEGIELAELEARGQRQLEQLEEHRLALARRTLTA